MTQKTTTFRRALFDLLSSMRFAISLLTILAIASIIGTVLKQNEPYVNYRVEFGDFWFAIFEPLGLFDVYHSGWFLVILAFLVFSTCLCIWRHFPGLMREIRSYREKASQNSLRLMSHHHETDTPLEQSQVLAHLTEHGYRYRVRADGDATLVAAKKGSWQRLGYLFTHSAIVVICIGGLMDGNLPLKVMEMLKIKTSETRNIPQSQIPEQSRLASNNLSFRGNVNLSEGSSASVIFLNSGNGYFVQELPFILKLKKFHIEHYSTGMPKLFASDVDVLDLKTGELRQSGTVKVNHPLIVDGIAIYQASFGDGGSGLDFIQWNLNTHQQSQLKAQSQSELALEIGKEQFRLEIGDLRPFNIETLAKPTEDTSTVAVNQFQTALASAQSVKSDKNLRNLGPTIQFKIRDNTGQAVEYQNYMQPFTVADASYFLTGMRREVSAPFRFTRIPLDEDMRLDHYMRFRSALLNPELHAEIAKRTAAKALAAGGVSKAGEAQFADITQGVLTQFSQGGFPAIERFLNEKVPKEQRQTVAQTYLKVLQSAAIDTMDVAQEQAGLPPIAVSEAQYRFLMDSLVATSSLFDYGSPTLLTLNGFNEVKSSGFQLTRSPGKNVVYLGSLLLIIGIFCMFYIRENRLWVRISPSNTLIAMSSNRKTADLDREFAAHIAALTSTTQSTH
ncbi:MULTISPECIES: cytochrome c biogenesis protein ResB [Deefgea]|uniref:Cytochrome c biogenesis protein ResB n=1 Tax=Deefgea chitinilytica TaxID=570276 RepID=A0ABS2CEG7_9NEIS|nr:MULTISPECIES: cytochrome c biogenesis protein ResB [Deefgea]MBM5572457.1 cytochrome c biogenesis protein ResB [Deefgea chitinilytica]MBM9889693.1 cytochrome c biogenesis protein ResB [Deefgea sp. CFH1-16]